MAKQMSLAITAFAANGNDNRVHETLMKGEEIPDKIKELLRLAHEQEVEISKRIEQDENEIKSVIYSFGFAGKEHIALAEKLVADPPRERFDRVILDKKINGREKHLQTLRKLIKRVRAADLKVD